MAQDLEQLVLSISADTRQIQRALKKLEGDTNASTRKVEQRFDALGKRVNGVFAGIGRSARGFLAGIAAAFTVREAQQLIDASTRIQNALKVAGLEGDELTRVYDRLFDSAQKNAAPLESLVTLYGRAAIVQKELGVSTDELLRFTDNVSLALRVAGTDAQSASGALLQLSQALGSGVVRAEEFSSMLEGALPIVQAAAAGLEEAGGSVAKLRQLVVDGKVSSEAFFRAFEAGASTLEQKVQGSVLTTGQATTKLWNALTKAAGEFNSATGASERFATGLGKVADAIASLDIAGLVDQVKQFDRAVDDAANSPFFFRLAEFLTGRELTVGQPISLDTVDAENDLANLERQIEILHTRIEASKEMAIDTTEAEAQLSGLVRQAAAVRGALAGARVTAHPAGTPGNLNSVAENAAGAVRRGGGAGTVSLNDFALSDDSDAKKRAGEYEKAKKAIDDTIASLVFEQQQLSRNSVEQRTYNELKRAGVELNSRAGQQIANLVAQIEAETQTIESNTQAREKRTESLDNLFQMGSDALTSIADGSVKAEDALKKLVLQLALAAAQAKFLGSGPLAGLFGGFSPTAGGFASMLGIPGYATGTSNHPGGLAIVGERGPELLNLPKGSQVIPSVPRISPAANQNGANVVVQVINNSSGTKTREERGKGPNGQELRRIIIEDVKSEFATGGFDGPMGARYGARASPTVR